MICGSRSRREVLVSSPLCRSLSDIFFASSCRIGRFVSGAFQRQRGWKYKVFRTKYYPSEVRCGDFSENRRLDLLFPKPAAILLHLNATIDAKGKTKWRKGNQSDK